MGVLSETKPPEFCLLVGIFFLLCMAEKAVGQSRSRAEILADLGIGSTAGSQQDCTYEIEGLDDWRDEGVTDPRIRAIVVCEEESLYNKTETLSKLKPVEIAEGVQLFADFKGRGRSYLVLDDPPSIDFRKSIFRNLPAFPEGSLAPIVVNDGRITFKRTLFSQNGGGYTLAGALYVTGRADVEVLRSEIEDCEGKIVGGIEVDRNGEVEVEFSLFQRNVGEKVAGAIHGSNKAQMDVENCGFFGTEPPKEFVKFAKGEIDTMPNVTVPSAGAIACRDDCLAKIEDTSFEGFSGKFGTFHSNGNAVVVFDNSNFTKNYAEFGAGMFIEGDRANVAKITQCVFEKNFARMGGGMVVVGKGTLNLLDVKILENRALVGGGMFSDFVLPGKPEYSACGKATEGSEIDIVNSTVAGNSAAENGGGVHSKCTKVAIVNCEVLENSAGLFGGGVFIDTGVELDAEDSEFIGNEAQLGGAAMFALNTTTVDADNCIIKENAVWGKNGGGALGAHDAKQIILTNNEIVDNSARGPGGGVWLKNVETLMIDSTKFAGNSADGRGGALYADGVEETFDMENSTVSDNISGAGGGGFSLNDVGTSFIATTSFTNNSAAADGGAIDLATPSSKPNFDLTLFDIPFERNSAGLSCGAIRAKGFKEIDFTSTVITGNEALADGGGLCMETFGNFTLGQSNMIKFNKAGGKGGGIHLRKSRGLTSLSSAVIESNEADIGVAINAEDCKEFLVEGMTFEENSAISSCGAIRLVDTGKVDFAGIEFSKNSAGSSNGGAVCLEGVEEFVSHNGTSFESNRAGESGGAIYVFDCMNLTFEETPFEMNSAGGSGGAIGGSGVGDLKANQVTFIENECEANGGGLGVASVENAVLDSVEFRNNSGGANGGALWISEGDKFTIKDTVFHVNEAGGDGGAFVVMDYVKGKLLGSVLTKNEAGGSGGGLVMDGVRDVQVVDTQIESNNARKRGGALQLLRTNMESSGLMLMENEAEESGGALLCESDSDIRISKANFTHNYARAGQSLTALCGCSVNVTHSVFLRERSRSNNGDFFKRARKCGAVIYTLECEFFGGPLKKLEKWLLVLIVLVGVLAFLACLTCVLCCYFRRSARKKAQALKDIEEGFPPSPIMAAPAAGRAASSSDGESLEGYDTEDLASTDDGSSYISESEEEEQRGNNQGAPQQPQPQQQH
ncbi:hypothetical protein BSKO_12310 [Bryopsis sp. KO-2023]|nr:hypothetical protein BSKO_12310 [Bryopsis sp. KO-2023]